MTMSRSDIKGILSKAGLLKQPTSIENSTLYKIPDNIDISNLERALKDERAKKNRRLNGINIDRLKSDLNTFGFLLKEGGSLKLLAAVEQSLLDNPPSAEYEITSSMGYEKQFSSPTMLTAPSFSSQDDKIRKLNTKIKGEKNIIIKLHLLLDRSEQYYQKRDYDQERNDLVEILNLNKDDAPFKSLESNKMYTNKDVYLLLGVNYDNRGEQLNHCIYFFNMSLKLTNKNEHENRSKIYNNLGNICNKQGHPKDAKDHYHKAIMHAKDANSNRFLATAYCNLIEVLLDYSPTEITEELLREADNLTNHMSKRLKLNYEGIKLIIKKQYNQAVIKFTNAREKNKNIPSYLYLIGVCCFKLAQDESNQKNKQNYFLAAVDNFKKSLDEKYNLPPLHTRYRHALSELILAKADILNDAYQPIASKYTAVDELYKLSKEYLIPLANVIGNTWDPILVLYRNEIREDNNPTIERVLSRIIHNISEKSSSCKQQIRDILSQEYSYASSDKVRSKIEEFYKN